jgi:SAM-dependent methyltransferase
VEKVDIKEYWNRVYSTKVNDKLGWYQEIASPSLDVISKLNLNLTDPILIVGAGTTTLVDSLLDLGYSSIIASDISKEALNKLKKRLDNYQGKILFVEDDLTDSTELKKLNNVILWQDRACLHFLTNPDQQKSYVKLVNKILKKDGYALIATFSLDAPSKCTGLEVKRYSKEMLEELFGKNFKLIDSFVFIYTMPNGDTRPYIYTLFKKHNQVY